MNTFVATAILVLGMWLGQSATSKPVELSSAEISALQKAAEGGDAPAEFALGQAYDYGNGIAQNDGTACLWYRKAAEQDFAPAQNALGLMYRAGRGVEQNKEQAVQWYRKAARQQNAKAMFNLATAYYNGDGVGISDSLAYAWFLLAQQNGSQPARDAVSRMKGAMQPWQLSSAFEAIGDLYEQGTDLPQDHRVAIDWYRQAAQIGEPSTRVKLSKFLIDQGGEQNYREALQSCLEAGKKLYSPGALCAGLLYQKGVGTAQNLPEAAKWFGESARMGNAQAMLLLGEMYWDGTGVKQDRVQAYVLMLLASTADLAKAQQDKALYERTLSAKELDKGRKQASEWARTHPTLGLKDRTPPPN